MANAENIVVKITRLGRIKDSQLEIMPFVIFTGESGFGKSYMALLCHYFTEVLVSEKRLTRFFEHNGYNYKELAKSIHNDGIVLEIHKKELEAWLAADAISYMGMMLGNNSLTGAIEVVLPKSVPTKFTFALKKETFDVHNGEDSELMLYLEGLGYRIKNEILKDESPFSTLLRPILMSALFGNAFRIRHTYVFPPSRGPILTERLIPETGMYASYLEDLSKLNRSEEAYTPNDEPLLSLLHKVLEGHIKRDNNKYLYQNDGMENPMPISAAAASVREMAPLELLVRKGEVFASSVLFEEPEAHLHPLKQRMMADILSAFANAGCFMQVTTHSDYLIRRLNELIRLHEVRERLQDEVRFNKLCQEIGTSPELSLAATSITAYILKANDDGSSRVERLNVDDGVPYITFSEAIKKSMDVESKLDEILDNEDE